MLRIRTSLKFGEDGLQGLSQNSCANLTATCPGDPEVRTITQKLRARKEMTEADEKRLDEWKEARERALEKAEEAGKADTANPPESRGTARLGNIPGQGFAFFSSRPAVLTVQRVSSLWRSRCFFAPFRAGEGWQDSHPCLHLSWWDRTVGHIGRKRRSVEWRCGARRGS